MTDPTPTETEIQQETTADEPKIDRQVLLTSLAEQLVAAREASGQSLEEVMRELKLRRVYLEALESGDWSNMPGQVYALGFLRQYAAYLNLDLEAEIEQLKDGQYRLTKPLTYPDPPIAPSRKWAAGVAVAFVLLFILFNIYGSHDEPRQGMPEESASSTQAPEAAPAPASKAAPPATTDMQIVGNATQEGETVGSVPASKPAESAAEEAPIQPKTTTVVAPGSETGPTHHVDLEASNGEVWLEIYLPDNEGNAGELLKQKLLQSGDHMLIDTRGTTLFITCGNAASLQVSVDGETRVAAGSLGKPGKVIRNYQLDMETPPQNDLSD